MPRFRHSHSSAASNLLQVVQKVLPTRGIEEVDSPGCIEMELIRWRVFGVNFVHIPPRANNISSCLIMVTVGPEVTGEFLIEMFNLTIGLRMVT